MPPRLFVGLPFSVGETLSLPPGPARHAQVLRLQPDSPLTLFNGDGNEWAASVVRMGRSDVEVRIDSSQTVDRELPVDVTLALGMPANERMDTVIEKATELGVAVIQPLICERSVLRLAGERAQKKVAHWQAVAVAASEQSGRTRVPRIEPVMALQEWLRDLPAESAEARWLLSFRDTQPLATRATAGSSVICLSGPEGGLTEGEEGAAGARGFLGVSLGPRVLRADTAPLAVLAYLGLAV